MFLLLLALSIPQVFALNVGSTQLNQSESQRVANQEFERCMNDTINGKPDGVCVGNGESNGCVGLTRAMENSGKKTKCFIPLKFFCALFGHKQNSQPAWVGVGAGHLQNFNKCVNLKFGDNGSQKSAINLGSVCRRIIDKGKGQIDKIDDDPNCARTGIGNSSTEMDGLTGGISAAIQDAGFLAALRNTNDGSERFGLKRGDILERTLKGEKLSDIIGSSPFAKTIDEKELQAFKDAADNPISTEIDLASGESVGGTNPSQEGERFAFVSSPGSSSSDKNKKEEEMPFDLAALVNEEEGSAGSSSVAGTGGSKSENGNGNSSDKDKIYRKPSSIYSSSDRSIFDQVSAVYRKRTPGLKNFDTYLKNQKFDGPKNVKDILESSQSPGMNL